MSINDARGGAWLAAEARLKNAGALAVHKGQVQDPLPEMYWACLAEAAIWAQLARVSKDVGFAVGTYIDERERREEEGRELLSTMLAERKDRFTTDREAGGVQ